MQNHVKHVVIAGGGTAGWMTAASLSKLLGKAIKVTLVESEEIGTVGVGEATIPPLLTLHKLLSINEQEFMRETNATFKLGIKFENWRDIDQDYIHSFGITGQDTWAAGFQHFWLKGQQLNISKPFGDYCPELVAAQQNRFAVLPSNGINYAYHLDASAYAKFLRKMAETNGATRVEGKIKQVCLHSENGFIDALTLESGQRIEGDFFIDCTGFRALLIEDAMHVGYDDWTHWLPCDSALAVQTEMQGEPVPYTRSIAHDYGWQWQIPLQHRMGNGLVYCRRYIDDDNAQETLLNNLKGEPITTPRLIRFRTGQRREHWHKNCLAIGLSSGFLEPLESTSIHLIQRSIIRFMQLFPYHGVEHASVNEFNQQTEHEVLNIRDFIILHYYVTERKDSPFWRYCRNMSIPDSLKHRIELFKESGRVFKVPNELFAENSWIQVMLGQGLTPEAYHPIVDTMSDDDLNQFLQQIEARVRKAVSQLPSHSDFLKHHCGG
ncbi:tryptophan halogenase family protein [Alteromonas sp. a30]|uniref:tryptophan halogenase family protein n=1 Tax=Alteromonas sp. a30 TaxID=2730917 RepID=UPI0022829810|nr:tryptophan halogenase family protein [Alteromonas sp. a30]MCY7294043.1 tryptophan 7-halogenase [Alteromonas sp. a30]